MSYFTRLLCTGILFGISQIGFTQIITWTDNIPSALQPFQNNPQLLASYTQDTIFIYGHPAVKTSVPTLKRNPQPSVS